MGKHEYIEKFLTCIECIIVNEIMKNNFEWSITKGSGNVYLMSISEMMQRKEREFEIILGLIVKSYLSFNSYVS